MNREKLAPDAGEFGAYLLKRNSFVKFLRFALKPLKNNLKKVKTDHSVFLKTAK